MNDFYEKELNALKKSNRLRTREIFDTNLYDFATNDYLGLAHNKELHEAACNKLEKYELNATKASMLVGGYHQIHKNFEKRLCELNGFEDGILVGSGFNANISLIESLVRKNDILLMDEEYHASGILPTHLSYINVEFFKHNDMQHLQKLLLKYKNKKRKIVAAEGIYSMSGEMVKKEIFELCDIYNAILIMDEAHSSGVIGDNLLGVFDFYDIKIKPNYIKMGTLGKAYGSFGAYILASKHIVLYLLNRAKPLIYATALSLYDTLLANEALNYINKNKKILYQEIKKRKQSVKEILDTDMEGLIVPIIINDNKKVLKIQKQLKNEGFYIGAIREPTVKKAILRIIARLGEDNEKFQELLYKISKIR